MKEKESLTFCLVLLSVIVLTSFTALFAQVVFAQETYRLRVFTYNGFNNPDAQQNGVDIVVLNRDTQVSRVHQFFGIPDTNTYFYFSTAEMPAGSSALVCAVLHGTTSPISCTTLTVQGSGALAEYVTLNLNPSGG